MNAAVLGEGLDDGHVQDLAAYVVLRYDERVARGDAVARSLRGVEEATRAHLSALHARVLAAAAGGDAASPLAALLGRVRDAEPAARDSPRDGAALQQQQWAALQRCIAFATFPHCTSVRALDAATVEVAHDREVHRVCTAARVGHEGCLAASLFASFFTEATARAPVGALVPPLALVGCVSYPPLDAEPAARVAQPAEGVPHLLLLRDGTVPLLVAPSPPAAAQEQGAQTPCDQPETIRLLLALHQEAELHGAHGIPLPSDLCALLNALAMCSDYVCHVDGQGLLDGRRNDAETSP
ncbi:hypothetical protein STCU_11466 [Strigomonas culicis]|uniref:Uncharacterized protein n=1 Tax=Strigomonas culicis TaxID=28005 RepID=S9TDW5_9TRYP|nr:hypothetical protein STCU_11466 [Strigomonas culicis]|eukprot:EPY16222.1 hypothetical protein STCU_11466 [Strigomonas culicis]